MQDSSPDPESISDHVCSPPDHLGKLTPDLLCRSVEIRSNKHCTSLQGADVGVTNITQVWNLYTFSRAPCFGMMLVAEKENSDVSLSISR